MTLAHLFIDLQLQFLEVLVLRMPTSCGTID